MEGNCISSGVERLENQGDIGGGNRKCNKIKRTRDRREAKEKKRLNFSEQSLPLHAQQDGIFYIHTNQVIL